MEEDSKAHELYRRRVKEQREAFAQAEKPEKKQKKDRDCVIM
jgi:hypothetical protein